MAEIFLDEGIDEILNTYFRGQAQPANLYVGLFTSQTASTVPARTATGGASPSGITEMTAASGTYARQAIACNTSDWGAPSTNGSGRKIAEAAAEQFTGFVGAAAANGFFIATKVSSQSGDKLICAANFASGAARAFAATADQLNLTPSVQFDG